MAEKEPNNGLSINIGRRLPASVRKQIRYQKSQSETPVVNVMDRQIRQAITLYSEIKQRLDEDHLSLTEEAKLKYQKVWLQNKIPRSSLPTGEALSSDERTEELRKLLEQPEAGSYLKQQVQIGDDTGRTQTLAATLRDDIEKMLGSVTHRGHR